MKHRTSSICSAPGTEQYRVQCGGIHARRVMNLEPLEFRTTTQQEDYGNREIALSRSVYPEHWTVLFFRVRISHRRRTIHVFLFYFIMSLRVHIRVYLRSVCVCVRYANFVVCYNRGLLLRHNNNNNNDITIIHTIRFSRDLNNWQTRRISANSTRHLHTVFIPRARGRTKTDDDETFVEYNIRRRRQEIEDLNTNRRRIYSFWALREISAFA